MTYPRQFTFRTTVCVVRHHHDANACVRLVDHYFARLHAHAHNRERATVSGGFFLPPNLIVDSSYQGRRSSSLSSGRRPRAAPLLSLSLRVRDGRTDEVVQVCVLRVC